RSWRVGSRPQASRSRAVGPRAAEVVFGEAGADASTGEVARRAGVGIGTVFRHFPTKRDLVEATLVRHFELLTRRALDLARAPDPGAALRTLIATMVRASTTKIVLLEQLVAGGGETAPAVQASRRLRDAVDALVRTAQRAGRVRSDVSVDEIYLLVRGLSQATATSRTDPATVERAVDIVVSGLTPPAART